jgi:DNA-binding beta-propeller fold protein YncE
LVQPTQWRPSLRRRATYAAGILAAAGVLSFVGVSAGFASSGTLSLLAGNGTSAAATAPGPATSSSFLDAEGVAVDHAGDVYFASSDDYRVFKVTPGGQLTVAAGTGAGGAATPGPATSSRLEFPNGVALDSSGNLYIADSLNNQVYEVTPSGTLSVVAGTGTAGVPTPGPATSSKLNNPSGVATDSAGNLYIAEYQGNRVDKINSSGTLSVIAGTGVAGTPTPGPAASSKLHGPDSVAVDSSGNLYIADETNSMVEKVTPAGTLSIFAGTGVQGTSTAGAATSSELNLPEGIATTSSGDVYITDNGSSLVVDVNAGQLSIVAGTGVAGASTYGVPATSSELGYPFGIAVTPAGGLVLGDDDNNVVDLIGALITAPAATLAPGVSGTAAVGQTLSATTGTWLDYPTGYTYQWQRCGGSPSSCSNISGATTSSYTLASGDGGYTVRVLVTATNGIGSTSDSSSATAAVPATLPPATPPAGGLGPSNNFTIDGYTHAADGAITLKIALPGPGSVSLLGTHSDPGATRGGSTRLVPGSERFAWARRNATAANAGSIRITLHPDAAGTRMFHFARRHRQALHINVWTTYTPTGGSARSSEVTIRVLAVRHG